MDEHMIENILADHHDYIRVLEQEVAKIKGDVSFGVWLDKENYPEATLPKKANDSDAGFDITSAGLYCIKPNERALIHTGVYLEMSEGWECQVRPRSGLALKKGITVLNTPGTVDCSYRGEVCVILQNHSQEDFDVNFGDRIAQIVFQRVPMVRLFELSEKPTLTSRGEGGFGSTGVKKL